MYEITTADLKRKFTEQELIELTDDANTGSVDEAVIALAIASGEEEFNLYASRYYAIPVTPLPAAVKEKVIDLCAYQLMTRRPRLLHDEAADGPFWIRLRKELLRWLEALASEKRTALIPGADENAAPVATGGRARVVTDTPVFTQENLKAF